MLLFSVYIWGYKLDGGIDWNFFFDGINNGVGAVKLLYIHLNGRESIRSMMTKKGFSKAEKLRLIGVNE